MRHWLILLLSLATIFTSCSTSQKETLIDQGGLELVENQKFSEADSVFGDILKENPGSSTAYYGQGLVFERQLFFYDAIEKYMMILGNDSSFVPALESIMRINRWLGLDEELENAARQYEKLNLQETSYYLNLARTYLELEQGDRAVRYLNRAVESGLNGALADILQARIYWLDGKFDSARVIFEKALADSDGSALFYNEAADFFTVSGLNDSAVIYGERALEADRRDFDIFLDQFFRCLESGYFTAARNLMKQVEINEDTQFLRNNLDFYYNMSRPEYYEASIAAFKSLRKKANYISTLFHNVQARSKLRDPMTCDNQMNRIKALMDKQSFSKPYIDFMNMRMVKQWLDIRDFIKAESILKEITDWRKDSREEILSRAYITHNMAMFDEYDAMMDSIYNLHSSHPVWLTGMADIYSHWTIHKYPEAEKYYLLAIKEQPWYRPAYQKLVKLYYDIKQYEKALEITNQFADFSGLYPEDAIEKAFCLLELGRYDEGLALYEKNIVPLKGDIFLYEKVINLLMRKYEFERVNRIVDLMVTLCPDNPDILVFSAVMKTDLKKYNEALELAERALEIEPDNLEAEVQKYFAWYWLGQSDEAFAAFEKLKDKDDNVTSLNLQLFCSIALVDAKKDMGKTGNMVRGSITIYRYSLKSYLNLVNYYRQQGNFKFAAEEAYNMATLFDDHPQAHFYLGWVRFLGQIDGAKEVLQKAIELGLKGEELARARDMLKKIG